MPAAPSSPDAAGCRANNSSELPDAEPTETALVPPRMNSTPEPSLTPASLSSAQADASTSVVSAPRFPPETSIPRTSMEPTFSK
jgi:hypothetical protein